MLAVDALAPRGHLRVEVVVAGAKGMEQGASASPVNNFQGRYIIRHPWTGPVTCKEPRYGRWGGPPNGTKPQPKAAQGLAFADRSASLGGYVAQDIPEIKVAMNMPTAAPPADAKATDEKNGAAQADAKSAPPADAKKAPADAKKAGAGCGCRGEDPAELAWLTPLLLLARRRRS